MSVRFSALKENVRVKSGFIKIKAVTISGKDGDYFVVVSPTLLVSGYAKTEAAARLAFEENILTFCEDVLNMTDKQLDGYIKSLGFEIEKHENMHYSKVYVDENGLLKGMELGRISISTLETARPLLVI